MPNYSIEVWYFGSGSGTGNENSIGNQSFRLSGSYSISVSGTTATATFKTKMAVKRGDGYSSYYGHGSNPFGDDYITINGVKKFVHQKNTYASSTGEPNYYITSSWTEFPEITHTVTYDATTSKTVTIAGGFCNPAGNTELSAFLWALTLPYTGTYYHKNHGLTSISGATIDNNGNVSLTLPAQITYTKCTAPTTITITPSESYAGQTVKFSFSGAQAGNGMSIKGYKLYWGYYGIPNYAPTTTSGWEYTDTYTTSSTSGSNINLTVDSGKKGYYLTLKMVTLSSYSSAYNSSISTAYGWCSISDPPGPETPSKPTVSFSATTVNAGDQIKATVNYNADRLYYKTPGSSSYTYTTGNTIYFYPDESGYFYCYAWNSKNGETATSSTYSKYITVYSYPPPAPSDVYVNGKTVDGIKGNSNANLYLPSSAWVYFGSGSSGEYYPDDVYVQIMYSTSYSTVATNGGSAYAVGTTNVPTVTSGYVAASIPSGFSTGHPGYYFKVRARFSNEYGNSSYTYSDEVFQVPSDLNRPTINSVTATDEGLADGYFSNSIDIKWTNPTVNSGNPYIESTEVIYQASSNNSSWGSTTLSGIKGSTTSAGINTKTVTANFTPGQYYRFGVRLTDKAGRIQDVIYTQSLYRGYGPELSNEVFSVTGPEEDGLVTIRPYTNTTGITFSSVKAVSDNPVTYTIDAYIEQKGLTIPILTNTNPTTTSGDTVTFTLTAEQINTLLKNASLKDNPDDTVWNSDFTTVRYRIYARDSAGMTSTINSSNNTQIKFIEAPQFVEGERISLGIRYTNNNSDVKMASTTTTGDANIANERMFNPGEAVYFKFNKATDYNDDITGYRIFVSRLDNKPSITYDANYPTGNFELLKTYSLDEVTIDNNEVSMFYPLSSYTQNKFLIFAVAAVDSKNNLSAYKYSETYLIGCRIQNATINLISTDLDDTDNKLKFTYTIPDLGGSRFVNSSVYTYTQYPNFERTISVNNQTYTKKARISLEYCLDGNFGNTDSSNYGITSIDYGSTTSFESIGTNDGSPITISTDTLPSQFLNTKLYARLTFITSTGLGTSTISGFENVATNITYSSVITYYADAPTVSHRAQHVGINTNTFDAAEDEIFVVSDFAMRDKIKFSGTNDQGEAFNIIINVKNGTLIGYDTNGNQTIEIDLKNKTIDGAIISGGSW